MKQLFYPLIILFIFTSCDPVFNAEIINNTKSEVMIQIGFDRLELEKIWQDKSYIAYLDSYPKSYDIG